MPVDGAAVLKRTDELSWEFFSQPVKQDFWLREEPCLPRSTQPRAIMDEGLRRVDLVASNLSRAFDQRQPTFSFSVLRDVLVSVSFHLGLIWYGTLRELD